MANGAAQADRLVITADDFGAAVEVNEAVEVAHREGVLTAASLMAAGAEADDAVRRARRNPGLAIGLHLTLCDGPPVLAPDEIPDLVDTAGRLRRDLAGLGLDLALKRRARTQMRCEIDAQFAAFAGFGLRLDHVNVHEHYHLHPIAGALVLEACRRHGARALRSPNEDARILRRLEPGRGLPAARVEAALAAWLRPRARAAGLVVPDHCFGRRWSGALHRERLAALLGALPPGLVEIYLHPATSGGFAESAPAYEYGAELEALTAPECRAALAASGRPAGGYAEAGEPTAP